MTRLIGRYRVAIVMIAVSACGHARPQRDTTSAIDAALVGDQHRRIASFDSVVRSVNTDSVYHLWQAMLTTSDVRKMQREMMCEEDRLGYRYGRAASAALERMNDTLWHGVDPAAVQRLDASLAGESPQIGRHTCEPMPSERAPYWLNHWTVYDLPKLPPSPDSNPPEP